MSYWIIDILSRIDADSEQSVNFRLGSSIRKSDPEQAPVNIPHVSPSEIFLTVGGLTFATLNKPKTAAHYVYRTGIATSRSLLRRKCVVLLQNIFHKYAVFHTNDAKNLVLASVLNRYENGMDVCKRRCWWSGKNAVGK